MSGDVKYLYFPVGTGRGKINDRELKKISEKSNIEILALAKNDTLMEVKISTHFTATKEDIRWFIQQIQDFFN